MNYQVRVAELEKEYNAILAKAAVVYALLQKAQFLMEHVEQLTDEARASLELDVASKRPG